MDEDSTLSPKPWSPPAPGCLEKSSPSDLGPDQELGQGRERDRFRGRCLFLDQDSTLYMHSVLYKAKTKSKDVSRYARKCKAKLLAYLRAYSKYSDGAENKTQYTCRCWQDMTASKIMSKSTVLSGNPRCEVIAVDLGFRGLGVWGLGFGVWGFRV